MSTAFTRINSVNRVNSGNSVNRVKGVPTNKHGRRNGNEKMNEIKLTVEQIEDLKTRFLFNLPQSEITQPFRIWYHIEHCWWFYLDYFSNFSQNQKIKIDHDKKKFIDFVMQLLFKSDDIHKILSTNNSITTICVNENTKESKNKNEHEHEQKSENKKNENKKQNEKEKETLKNLRAQLEIQYHQYQTQYSKMIPISTAVIFNPNNCKILMIRSKHSSDGKFGVPKGKIDFGETPEAAAKREWIEETGIFSNYNHNHNYNFINNKNMSIKNNNKNNNKKDEAEIKKLDDLFKVHKNKIIERKNSGPIHAFFYVYDPKLHPEIVDQVFVDHPEIAERKWIAFPRQKSKLTLLAKQIISEFL